MKLINLQSLTISDLILFSGLLITFIFQLYFLLRYYLKLALHKDSPTGQFPEDITVIIPVRNEEEKIRTILDNFSSQEFENHQILVINQYSEDNTFEILTVLAETNQKLKVTSLSQDTRFLEKQAINLGMKGASAPWIIFLTPVSGEINPEWLAKLNGLLSDDTDAIIAYTNAERSKGFRNLICRLERFTQFVISGAWTLSGKPFVFNENNVLFRKTMYFETSGFRYKLNRNFANLELIFNENFKKKKIKIAVAPETTIRENIEDDRGDHIKLLKKGAQIRQSLSWRKKVSLFTDDLSKILLVVFSTVLCILHPEYWITILTIPFIYLILLIIIVNLLLKRLNERKLFLTSLVYILIKPLITWWFFGLMYLLYRRNKWN